MIVFLQDPLIDPRYFDLVSVPFHDPLRGANVLVTEGAPNRISIASSIPVVTPYDDVLQRLPSPRVAIFIGGKSKRHSLSEKNALNMIRMIKRMQDDYGAGLMISTSRRTSKIVTDLFKDQFTNGQDCFLWSGEGENPYQAMFKYADSFIVTEDSISMLSEAATTGKPVYRLEMQGKPGKFNDFYTYMEERDTIRPFQGSLDQWRYRPLNDAEMLATIIKSELKNRS